jgi:hypothetical protein
MRFARKTTASRLGTIASILIAGLLAGCASSSSGPAKKKPAASQSYIPAPGPDNPGRPTAISAKDPCADRLHALCGPLLLYFAVNHHLPAHIDELRAFAGDDPEVQFICPVSGKPYIYDPRGLRRSGGKPGIIILSDPEPSHSGMRLAVVVEETRTAVEPLIVKVIPEQEIVFHDAQQATEDEAR